MKKPKNTITTPSYFCKRLKDNGFIVLRLFSDYSKNDPRRWTVMVDPGKSSTLITCYTNKVFGGDVMFEIYDGGQRFPKNFNLKTESIETVISYLLRHGVDNNNSPYSPYYVKPKYLSNEQGRRSQQKEEEANELQCP